MVVDWFLVWFAMFFFELGNIFGVVSHTGQKLDIPTFIEMLVLGGLMWYCS